MAEERYTALQFLSTRNDKLSKLIQKIVTEADVSCELMPDEEPDTHFSRTAEKIAGQHREKKDIYIENDMEAEWEATNSCYTTILTAVEDGWKVGPQSTYKPVADTTVTAGLVYPPEISTDLVRGQQLSPSRVTESVGSRSLRPSTTTPMQRSYIAEPELRPPNSCQNVQTTNRQDEQARRHSAVWDGRDLVALWTGFHKRYPTQTTHLTSESFQRYIVFLWIVLAFSREYSFTHKLDDFILRHNHYKQEVDRHAQSEARRVVSGGALPLRIESYWVWLSKQETQERYQFLTEDIVYRVAELLPYDCVVAADTLRTLTSSPMFDPHLN